MAQLSNDCSPLRCLLTVAQHLPRLRRASPRWSGIETVPLDGAAGGFWRATFHCHDEPPAPRQQCRRRLCVSHADLLPDRETVLPVNRKGGGGHPLGRSARRGEAIRSLPVRRCRMAPIPS